MGGYRFTDAWYPRACALPAHAHARDVVTFTLAGSGEQRFGGKTEDCPPLSLTVLPAGVMHSNRMATACRCFIIELPEAASDPLERGGAILDRPRVVEGAVVLGIGLRLHREFRRPDGPSLLAVDELVLELAQLLAPGRSRVASAEGAPWLLRARERLRTEFHRPFRMMDLAVELGVHPVYFTRAFRRRFGCTPADYVRQVRMEEAHRLLAHTPTRLSDVAAATGFADQSQFTKQFHRRIGMSPGRYRAAIRTLSLADEGGSDLPRPAFDRSGA